MTTFYTDTAVTRETAFLQTSGDGLPALLTAAGGPWDDVQAYAPRVFEKRVRKIYVMRHRIKQRRFAAQRAIDTYPMRLFLFWAFLDPQGSAETEQGNFDYAINLLLERIAGFLGDKTHGGAFLAAAPTGDVLVDFADPLSTIPSGYLQAEVTYDIDDVEVNN